MSIVNFVPEIWSSEILVNLRNSLVYGALCNRDYEGEIENAGDTVHITSFGKPTISAYSKYGTLTYEQLTDATRALVIDQQESFSFAVDDVDRRQALGGMIANASSDAAFGLAETTDNFVAQTMYAAVNGTANDVGAVALDISNANGYGDVLVAFRTLLNRAKVPAQGRWAVLPPEAYGALLQDIRFISAAESGDQANVALRQGLLGRILGFDVYESNNAPLETVATWDVIAGHPIATTFADQLLETEAVRMIDFFGDGLRGLHVYGAKVVRPEALCLATVTVQA